MNEPPGAAPASALGLTVAEYFRDQGQDVLFFVDNIFRFTQAGSEVSALLGRIPVGRGLPADAGDRHGRELQERITSTKKGSITSVQAIYVPADDLTDPAPATDVRPPRRDHGAVASIAELGIYPAVDPLDSTSRMLDPGRRRGALPVAPSGAGCCSATSRCRTSSPSSAWTSCRGAGVRRAISACWPATRR